MNFSGTLRVNKFACFTLVFILFLVIYWRSGRPLPTDKNDLVNLKTVLKAAIFVAERGGKKVIDGKNHKLNIKSKGETKEGVNDPVTDADYASHCAMYHSLKKTFPKVTVVSEEHNSKDEDCEKQPELEIYSRHPEHKEIDYMYDELVYAKDVTIWIDPLDATKEYTEALYQYVTTMVCVAINGVPIIGVIHYPFPPRTYWGWVSKQTSANLPNVFQKEAKKKAPKVVISRSHAGNVAKLAKKAFGPKTMVSEAAGSGYKVMTVANGTYDVYLHATAIKKWDLCAGDALIKTVEGKMTTAKGKVIDYSPNGDVVVTDGVLVTRFDHDYYLSKLPALSTVS